MNYPVKILTLLLCFILGKGFLMAQHLMHYSSERFEYSMLLPEDWKRTDELKSSSVSLILLSPDEASVSVSFYNMKGLSIDNFIEGYTKSLMSDSNKLQLQEKGTFKARDDAADYMIYTYFKGDVQQREKVCFFQRESEVAVVSAKQVEKDFNNNLSIFNEIFISFTFETNQEKVENID